MSKKKQSVSQKKASRLPTETKGHLHSPETLMLGHGYNPWWSEGSVKPPLFLTSTFMFKRAEDGEEFFKIALGKKEARKTPGLIYSRLNTPELEILEGRLAVWENAEAAAAFASGMAAISTTVLALCRPGDVIAYTLPIYGGTGHFFQSILPNFGVRTLAISPEDDIATALRELREPNLRMIFLETPSNPTLLMTDIQAANEARREQEKRYKRKIHLAVDNTLLGPVFQKPIHHGADLSVYSATKFIGGHSDLIAGVVNGNKDLLQEITAYRSFLGSMSSSFTCWLMMRSLETLKIRMESQAIHAARVAEFLVGHKEVSKVYYPGLVSANSPGGKIIKKQTTGPGSIISFEVKGGKAKAFAALNRVQVCRLAVSLGGTESLIEHPKTMTHSEIDASLQERCGITDGLIRLSVGLENPVDLIADLKQALK